MKFRLPILFFFLSLGFLQAQTVIVDANGTGNFVSVNAAINAAPTTATAAAPYIIFVKNGVYFEKDTIPSNKPFIVLIGESVANTIIRFNAGASSTTPSGGTYGTQGSATFTVNAPDFTAINISFDNSYGDGSQAVAITINNDRAAFNNCRFLGNQDTVYTKGNGTPRCYFKNCYIDGNVDFIFGNAIALFDSCYIYAKTRSNTTQSYITAANTPAGQAYGYVFRDCFLPANIGNTNYFLARPWQNTSSSSPIANNKTVFLKCTYGYHIRPEGWSVWDATTNTSVIYFGEYKCRRFDSTFVNTSQRVSWSYQLADSDYNKYSIANLFGSWNPCNNFAQFCNYVPKQIAVSNFKGVKQASNSSFNFNISWPITGIVYELYRSINNQSNFTSIAQVTAANDTSVNFQFTDALPPAGSIYYYYVKASFPNMNSHFTDTVFISSAPTVLVTGKLGSFIQSLNPAAPSASQLYTVKGINLLSDVTITPPTNFEVSNDGGTTWFTNSNPLVITRTADSIPTSSILVRLNANQVGVWADTIKHITTGTGAINALLPVTGKTVSTALLILQPLQIWPMNSDNLDSAAIRSIALQATTPRFNNLYSSLGTGSTPSIPAYSSTYGQAFGASTTKDGGWGQADGGPGGNLRRTYYEEFKVKTVAGKMVRVDSITFNANFYNTSSNTKLAIVVSKSGFTQDSTEITGATFASPIVLNKLNGTILDAYAIAFNGADGDTLSNLDSLTIRLYFSCGSSSAGRYGLLKNVTIKGAEIVTTPLDIIAFDAIKNKEFVQFNFTTANEFGMKQIMLQQICENQIQSLASVDAKNKSINNYSIRLNSNLSGRFRLACVDNNGKISYSKIVEIVADKDNSLSLYPNPVSKWFKLEHAKAGANAMVFIYDMHGSLVKTQKVVEQSTLTSVELGNLSNGTYNIIFSDNKNIYKTSFIKN